MRDIDKLCMGCMNERNEENECGHCDFNERTPQSPNALPYRAVLENRYYVGRVLDFNGEGITYIAYDNVTDATVRLREYFPDGLCEREDHRTVIIIKGCEYAYNENLMKFLSLARSLAKMRELSAILPVYDIFETGGTAYYVSEYLDSITYREFLLRNRGVLRWSQARPLFMPLLSTLEALHNAGIFHRGISPETILIGRDSKLKLTGFCTAAARTARTDLPSELFPGYAAIEQYDDEEPQGPWTDIYAFAATIYRTLVGSPPPDALERAANDRMIIPAQVAEGLPAHVLTALAYALQILPDDRTSDVESFRAEISGAPAVTAKQNMSRAPRTKAPEPAGREHTDDDEPKKKKGGGKLTVLIAALLTIVFVIAIGLVVYFTMLKKPAPTPLISSEPEVSAPQSNEPVSYVSVPPTQVMVNVPKFITFSYASALANEYVAAGKLEIEYEPVYNGSYKRGIVCEQTPKAGESVPQGTKIKVKVSLGPQVVRVPANLVGLSEKDAKYELLKMGFIEENIEVIHITDSSKKYNEVIETIPKANTEINIFGKIELRVNDSQSLDDE